MPKYRPQQHQSTLQDTRWIPSQTHQEFMCAQLFAPIDASQECGWRLSYWAHPASRSRSCSTYAEMSQFPSWCANGMSVDDFGGWNRPQRVQSRWSWIGRWVPRSRSWRNHRLLIACLDVSVPLPSFSRGVRVGWHSLWQPMELLRWTLHVHWTTWRQHSSRPRLRRRHHPTDLVAQPCHSPSPCPKSLWSPRRCHRCRQAQ